MKTIIGSTHLCLVEKRKLQLIEKIMVELSEIGNSKKEEKGWTNRVYNHYIFWLNKPLQEW
jgi:hypothetical protein